MLNVSASWHMNPEAPHKPVSALKLFQTFKTYKGGSRAGAEVGQAQFICQLRQEVGPLAFTAAVELEDSHISEFFSKHALNVELLHTPNVALCSRARTTSWKTLSTNAAAFGLSGSWTVVTMALL